MSKDRYQGVLSGLKVLELAHVIAGPFAGGLLADLGADVVHVEPPGSGDSARRMGPDKDGVHVWWKVVGRNKQSIVLDLREESDREVARELAAEADVVITNFRARTLERWRLGWDALHELNPKLVMLQVSGYGLKSSRSNDPGFGKMGEARSGVVAITGFPDGPPIHSGFSHADTATGLMGAFAIMSAMYRRTTDPGFDGEWIDLALFEPLFRMIDWQVPVYDQLGIVAGRNGNHPAIKPAAVMNLYPAADGEWITVTSATPRSVLNIVRMLGLDEEEFGDVIGGTPQAAEVDKLLGEWMASRSSDACLESLERAEVVASRIFTVQDIVEDDIYDQLDLVISVEDDDLGALRMCGVVPRMLINPGGVWRSGPALGVDTDDVLDRWLGHSGTASS